MKVELVEARECFDPGDDCDMDDEDQDRVAGNIALNMNDFFAWGCSDDEPIPEDKVEEVYRIWKAFPDEDALGAWVSIRRGMEPQPPVLKRKGGQEAWDNLKERVREMMTPPEEQK